MQFVYIQTFLSSKFSFSSFLRIRLSDFLFTSDSGGDFWFVDPLMTVIYNIIGAVIVAQPASCLQPRCSELLRFVVDKCNIIPFDQLVKLCTDYYHYETAIMSPSSELDPLLQNRLQRRTGANKRCATMEESQVLSCESSTVLRSGAAASATSWSKLWHVHHTGGTTVSMCRSLWSEISAGRSYRAPCSTSASGSAVQNNDFPALTEARGSTNNNVVMRVSRFRHKCKRYLQTTQALRRLWRTDVHRSRSSLTLRSSWWLARRLMIS